MHKRMGGLALATALAVAALSGLGWAVSTAAAAPSAGDVAAQAAAPPSPNLDPRWLQLVRSLARPSSTRAPASAGPTIDYLITDQMLAGHVPVANTVFVSVTRGASTLAAFSLTPFPDESGFLYAASLSGPPTYLSMDQPSPGDVIWVTQAHASISLTVPALDGLAWPATDSVSGTAPANASLLLYLYPFADPATVYTRTANANGVGQYVSAWSPAVDIRPRDSGFVMEAPDGSRRAYARFVAPFLRAQLQGYGTEGFAAPHSDVIVTVTTITGSVLGSRWTTADASGQFSACADDCAYFGDNLPAFEPGETLIAAAAGQTFSLTLPTLTAHANLAGGTVQGQAAPGQPVVITRFSGPAPEAGGDDGPPASQGLVTATVGGSYSLALPLAPRDYGEAAVTDAQGNEAYARFAVPYLNAQLGAAFAFGYDIQGQLDDQAGPLTITVQGASGPLKGIRFERVGTTGFFIDPYRYYYGVWDVPNIALEAGDRITLTTARGVQLADTIPLLTAQADVSSQTIAGRAPPGGALAIHLDANDVTVPAGSVPPGGYDFAVTTTAQGAFALNFASTGHFGPQATGSISDTSPAGHVFTQRFQTDQDCLPRLLSVQVNGASIEALAAGNPKLLPLPDCIQLSVSLLDGQGHLKYHADLTPYPGEPFNVFPADTSGQPILVRPGDHLMFSSGGQSLDQVIPTLTVTLNPATGTISGQAPPGAGLSAYLLDANLGKPISPNVLTTTASAQGDYQFGGVALGAHQVAVFMGGLPQYLAFDAAPFLSVRLYDDSINALARPFAPFTLTLRSPGQSPAVFTGTADAGGNAFYKIGHAPWPFEPGASAVLTTPAGIRSLTLPPLTAHLDAATGTVTGTAPAGAHLKVYVDALSQAVTATAQGRFSVVFGYQEFGTGGTVVFANSEGDEVDLDFSLLRWNVTLDSACAQGYAPLPAAATTVTLTAPTGSVKGTVHVAPRLFDGQFSACFSAPVETGDRLSLSGPDGLVSYTVPGLTAAHDPAHRWVTGSAPANSLVTFSLNDNRIGQPVAMRRQVLAGADGHYGLDVSDLELILGDTGSANVQDAEGNTVQRNFVIQGLRTYLPLVGGP